MSESTPLLDLPFIMAAQAQKHVTHNDALLDLDALVQLSALSRAVADPPASPQEGDRYLVASPATGDWTGNESAIVAFQDGIWQFHTPKAGWRLWIADEARFLVHDGSQWRSVIASADLQNLSMLGINTTADATNKLSAASDAVLFNHNGSDSQVKVNKAAAGDTASHLFQTDFCGRAEFGLTGDDNFHAKVSPDGSTWHEGILIDKDTGVVAFPSGLGETGTFNPQVTFDTPGDFSPTYTRNDGDYLVFGDVVLFSLRVLFNTNAYTTASGNFLITGLPFAAHSNSLVAYYPMGGRFSNVYFGGTGRLPVPVFEDGVNYLRLFMCVSGAGGNWAITTHIPASTSNIDINVTGVYQKG